MTKGDRVWTFRATNKLTAPGKVDGQSGTITGVIPGSRVSRRTRYEVTFDDRRVNSGCTFDFYAVDLEVI